MVPIDETMRDAATRRAAYFADFAIRSETEMSALSRWLTATLVAINGGGALAVANAAKSAPGLTTAGTIFIAGLTFAMFSGWFNQLLASLMISPSLKLADYWSLFLIAGERDDKAEIQLNLGITKIGRWQLVGPGAGFISFGLFVCGAYCLSAGIVSGRAAIDPVCNRLKVAMLSNAPEHSDARLTFTALGCAN